MSDAIEILPFRARAADAGSTLQRIAAFGSNPGQLDMRLFEPSGTGKRRPLVVVLHGCAQTVEGYDVASGWSRLAERHDFLLLYPEQRQANNPQRCFRWFEPSQTQAGRGEVESIHQMIATAEATFGADPRRVFICGLSAGGAMAAAMLAAHPSLFRGGAIIAGLPYGAASNASEAYQCMSVGRIREAHAWGDLVRNAAATPHTGPWPTLSIWHGTADQVVKPINAGELIKQWTNVHRLGNVAPRDALLGTTARRAWRDDAGREVVTAYTVPGLAHGAPVDDVDPPAPFFLPAGISSTWQIARDWGLTSRSRLRNVLAILGL